MPYLDSNIPFEIFYELAGSELLRITWTTTDMINMVLLMNLYVFFVCNIFLYITV